MLGYGKGASIDTNHMDEAGIHKVEVENPRFISLYLTHSLADGIDVVGQEERIF